MKNRRRVWIEVLLLTILLSQAACGSIIGAREAEIPFSNSTVAYETYPTSTPDQKIDPSPTFLLAQSEEIARIRQATVMIRMQSLQREEGPSIDVALGMGIGSLIQINGEILLVTHNHWGEMLQDLTIVELRNADNQMIKPIYGYQFKEMIVYQDPGTLILRAFPELIQGLTPAKVMDAEPLKPGDAVQVAFREKPERDRIAVLDAVVKEISTYEGEAIYKLQCQNGDYLQPGDSGGGVWHDGKLAGNNWVVLVTYNILDAPDQSDPASETITDIAYTAILPEDF